MNADEASDLPKIYDYNEKSRIFAKDLVTSFFLGGMSLKTLDKCLPYLNICL